MTYLVDTSILARLANAADVPPGRRAQPLWSAWSLLPLSGVAREMHPPVSKRRQAAALQSVGTTTVFPPVPALSIIIDNR